MSSMTSLCVKIVKVKIANHFMVCLTFTYQDTIFDLYFVLIIFLPNIHINSSSIQFDFTRTKTNSFNLHLGLCSKHAYKQLRPKLLSLLGNPIVRNKKNQTFVEHTSSTQQLFSQSCIIFPPSPCSVQTWQAGLFWFTCMQRYRL